MLGTNAKLPAAPLKPAYDGMAKRGMGAGLPASGRLLTESEARRRPARGRKLAYDGAMSTACLASLLCSHFDGTLGALTVSPMVITGITGITTNI